MSPPETSAAAFESPTMSSPTIELDDAVGFRFDWEEPHPGQRLSFSHEVDKGRAERQAAGVGLLHQINLGGRGGMAAKGLRPFHQNGKLVRRNIRLRTRSSATKAGDHSPPVAGEKRAANGQAPANDDTESSSYTSTVKLLSPVTSVTTYRPGSGNDTEMETATVGEVGQTEDDASPSKVTVLSRTSPCALTDFSNLLGIMVETGDEEDSMTVVDPDAVRTPSVDEDMYGWEAELRRKSDLSRSVSDSSPLGIYPAHQTYRYRRTNGNKRNLLHRVFSMGTNPRESAAVDTR